MDREQKNGVTLRQVYYQWYQNGTLKKLPKITLSEDQIQVWLDNMAILGNTSERILFCKANNKKKQEVPG